MRPFAMAVIGSRADRYNVPQFLHNECISIEREAPCQFDMACFNTLAISWTRKISVNSNSLFKIKKE